MCAITGPIMLCKPGNEKSPYQKMCHDQPNQTVLTKEMKKKHLAKIKVCHNQPNQAL